MMGELRLGAAAEQIRQFSADRRAAFAKLIGCSRLAVYPFAPKKTDAAQEIISHAMIHVVAWQTVTGKRHWVSSVPEEGVQL